MSTTELHGTTRRVDGGTRRSVLPVALVATGAALALAAWGTFGDSTAPNGTSEQHSTSDFLIVAAIAVVAALVVFGWAVPRALRKTSTGAAALTLGILALVTVAAFWSGLPPVLAGGAILLGWYGRVAPTHAWLARAGLALGLLALVADVVVYIGDTG
jgi:hypothetical protein